MELSSFFTHPKANLAVTSLVKTLETQPITTRYWICLPMCGVYGSFLFESLRWILTCITVIFWGWWLCFITAEFACFAVWLHTWPGSRFRDMFEDVCTCVSIFIFTKYVTSGELDAARWWDWPGVQSAGTGGSSRSLTQLQSMPPQHLKQNKEMAYREETKSANND